MLLGAPWAAWAVDPADGNAAGDACAVVPAYGTVAVAGADESTFAACAVVPADGAVAGVDDSTAAAAAGVRSADGIEASWLLSLEVLLPLALRARSPVRRRRRCLSA